MPMRAPMKLLSLDDDTEVLPPRPIELLAWRLELLRKFSDEETERIVRQVERAMKRREAFPKAA